MLVANNPHTTPSNTSTPPDAILDRFQNYALGKALSAREPFISGNPEPENAGAHIPATNLYWGFTEALKGWYQKLLPIHTGVLTDYVAWFLGVMALTFIIALAG